MPPYTWIRVLGVVTVIVGVVVKFAPIETIDDIVALYPMAEWADRLILHAPVQSQDVARSGSRRILRGDMGKLAIHIAGGHGTYRI